jgi:hypothetical protein
MIHDRPEGRPFGAARPGLPPAAVERFLELAPPRPTPPMAPHS